MILTLSVTPIDIIYQVLGIFAGTCNIVSFQFKKNKQLLTLQLIAGFLCVVHFFLIKAWAGMLLNVLVCARSIFYISKKSKICNLVFCSLVCLLTIGVGLVATLLLDEVFYIAIIVCAAQIVGTIALATQNSKVIRICQFFFVSPCWLFNNIFYFSIGGIISECFNMISALVSYIRFYLLKKEKKHD